MAGKPKKKRGAPCGNQNARKQGFDSNVLCSEQLEQVPLASSMKTLQSSEATLARLNVFSIAKRDPHNHALVIRALASVHRIARTQQEISRNGSVTAQAFQQFVSYLFPRNKVDTKL